MDPSPRPTTKPDSFSPRPYSQGFKDLIADEDRLRELMEGSYALADVWNKDEAMEGWEHGRRFIAQAINKDGSFLDYGCANGFLLRSLQEWSPSKINVYGMDIDPKAVKDGQQLFPSIQNHFTTPEELNNNPEYPREFDMVYWNVWDDWDFKDPHRGQEDLLKKLLKATNKGARLIPGFYNTREANSKTIEQLQKLGYKFSGILENPSGGQEMIAWMDKLQD